MKRVGVTFIFLLFFGNLFAQNEDIVRGRVMNDTIPVMGVHVQNLHTQLFSTTDEKGYFTIKATAGNTLQLTHVSMQTVFRNISKADFQFAGIVVQMKEHINELEEVQVTKHKNITAQELGILQHTPIRRTYGEKKLFSSGGGIISIINIITGRRKQIKKDLQNERNMAVATYISENMGNFLKKELKLSEEEVNALAYYVMERPEFHKAVQENNLKDLEFMLIDVWVELQGMLERELKNEKQ
ncbi:carboxypeptidase-like regulatory domain-containing protein [Capnocytophaga cynodegmi]|uniref:carboxypeptidase-like regulatory domain-containing protein n=1 Tax=Capnocytophaga cynodegmi TaxID=28189 RepID=UPI00385A12EC